MKAKLFVLALLAACCLATFVKGSWMFQDHHGFAIEEGCVRNLASMEGAKETFKLEKALPIGAPCTPEQLAACFSNRKLPKCPGGGAYTLGNIGTPPRCSCPTHDPTILQQQYAAMRNYYLLALALLVLFLVVLCVPTTRFRYLHHGNQTS